MSKKIIVRPKNPRDIVPEEAEQLAKAIRVCCPKYKVRVKINGYKGYAVTWYEVIEIAVVSGLTGEVVRLISKVAIDWARERFNQKQSGRPKAITIFGPKGEVLKSLTLKNATDEPEDTTKEGIDIEEIAKKYRKALFWKTTCQRLRRTVSKLRLRKD
jgi:hypothetical protein